MFDSKQRNGIEWNLKLKLKQRDGIFLLFSSSLHNQWKRYYRIFSSSVCGSKSRTFSADSPDCPPPPASHLFLNTAFFFSRLCRQGLFPCLPFSLINFHVLFFFSFGKDARFSYATVCWTAEIPDTFAFPFYSTCSVRVYPLLFT